MTTRSGSPAECENAPVVVTTDFSESSRAAFAGAAALARATGRPLDVVHVARRNLPGLAPWADLIHHEVPDRFFQDVQAKLANFVESEPAFAGLAVSATCLRGVPVDEITKYIRDVDAHVLVVASHGHSPIKEFFLGSLAEKLVRLVPGAVLTVDVPSATLRAAPRRILVAHDFSGDSCEAFRWASAWSRLFDASVRVVAVVPEDLLLYHYPDAKQIFHRGLVELGVSLRRQLDELESSWIGAPFSALVRQGNAAAEILAEAQSWQPDVIAIGRRSLGGDSDFRIGSVAERVLRRAPTAVLCVSERLPLPDPPLPDRQ